MLRISTLLFIVFIAACSRSAVIPYEYTGNMSLEEASKTAERIMMAQHKKWKPNHIAIKERYILIELAGTQTDRIYYKGNRDVQVLSWKSDWYTVAISDETYNSYKILRTKNLEDAKSLARALKVIISTHNKENKSINAEKNNKTTAWCDDFVLPKTNKVHLLISKEYEPPKKIVSALKRNISYALLKAVKDVKIINDIKEAGKNALILKISIINITPGLITKRIGIRYVLTETAKNTDVAEGRLSANSKMGYSRATIRLGASLAKHLDKVFDCIESRRYTE